jgi:hypothetical protein
MLAETDHPAIQPCSSSRRTRERYAEPLPRGLEPGPSTGSAGLPCAGARRVVVVCRRGTVRGLVLALHQFQLFASAVTIRAICAGRCGMVHLGCRATLRLPRSEAGAVQRSILRTTNSWHAAHSTRAPSPTLADHRTRVLPPGPRARGRRIALDRQASARRPPARIPAPSGLRLCVTGVALFALARTRSRPQQTRRRAQHHGTVAPHCCAVRSLSSTNTWRDSLASTESEIECDPAWDQWVRNSR